MARSQVVFSGAVTLSALLLSGTSFAADCFVDSVAGSDTADGKTESTAWQSLSKIASSCTTVKFKRGSVFDVPAGSSNYAVKLMGTQIKTLTNYGDPNQPLPKFIKPHETSSGAVFSSFSQITIDGLYISGSRSDAAMSNLADGICIMIGGGSASQPSVIKNCEITLCDIGMMTSGDYVEVSNNYVHDLSISVDAPPGVDPNAVGGAEGIFVNSSHVRVHHNRFINCSTAAQWVSNTNGGGVRCDGGATEVSVPNGKNGAAGEITDVEIDHNFSYNSCGFFEVASMFQSTTPYVKGKFTNSVFHDNVMVDSGWISLLQINNTRLTNVRWENNTIVHHNRPTVADANGKTIDMNDFGSSMIQAIPFNDTSSGVTGGGVIEAGDIYWTNNLWYFDPKVVPYSPVDSTRTGSDQFLKNIVVTGDILVTSDPGFKDITSTTDPAAYQLVKGSTAIDKGVSDDSITSYVKTDFSDRPRPFGAAYDLGAFEYQGDAAGGAESAGGAASTNGTSTGGSRWADMGGAGSAVGGAGSPNGTSGSPSTEGSCSCRVAGEQHRSTVVPWFALFVLGAFVGRKRLSC
jgi:MYXO-CTERM domain-containing protein